MPIRAYLCDSCGYEFDEIVRSTDPDDYATAECRCGEVATLIPSRTAPPRGSFGTTRRDASKDKPQKFNFKDEAKQTEFNFDNKE